MDVTYGASCPKAYILIRITICSRVASDAYMDVGHDVVATDLLLDASNFEGLISHGQVGAHLLKGLVGDLLDAEFLLSLGEEEPELPPGGCPGPRGEQGQHLLGCVAGPQRGLVRVEAGHDCCCFRCLVTGKCVNGGITIDIW